MKADLEGQEAAFHSKVVRRRLEGGVGVDELVN